LSSVPLGYNEFGHMQFDTKRSELGELLFRLKNRGDASVVAEIIAAASTFLGQWRPPVEVIVPVPPSSARALQPVMVLAQGLSEKSGIPIVEHVRKTRDTPQLKNVFDLDERLKVLEGVHAVEGAVAGQRVLLFDDLYRSGATMNVITELLYRQGNAADVYALTITRTRSNQ